MSSILLYCVLTAIVALIGGVVIGRQLASKARQDHEAEAQARARQLLEEAEAQANRRAHSAVEG
jgi:ribonuclease Y